MSAAAGAAELSTHQLPPNAHVLLVLTGALGDVARGIVVPTILKQERPDLKISWLVEDRWRELVDLCPSVDSVIPYYRKSSYWGIPQLRTALRSSGPFHCTLDLQRHFKSGTFARMSGAVRRVGFAPSDGKEGNWLFQTEYIPPCDMTESKVFHYRAFVSKILNSEVGSVVFDVDRALAEEKVRELLPKKEQMWVACVLGSSWPSKDWMLSGYSSTLKQLLDESDCSVILAGDKSQQEVGAKLSELHPSRIHNLAGKTSLTQLAGLLSLSDVAFGPDTGSGHISSIVGTPYVGLFGPTDPRRVAPFGSDELSIASLVPCRPCARRTCPGLNTACMRLISPKQVAGTILSACDSSSVLPLKVPRM